MKTFTVTCRIKPYIQPFERRLAMRELAAVSGSEPVAKFGSGAHGTEFQVQTSTAAPVLAGRLSYWETVEREGRILTIQSRREATVFAMRKGASFGEITQVMSSVSPETLPNRRCLRYGPHGIHEYRGKFFPQLVRVLLNIAGIRETAIVLDPMCGSGTALVESALMGHTGLGLDSNPLSVFMSRVKCELLGSSASTLQRTYEHVCEVLVGSRSRVHGKLKRWCDVLTDDDRLYLTRWFSEEVLQDLDLIMGVIQSVKGSTYRNLFVLSLSNILRRVSWQEEDDLRVRRKAQIDQELDPKREFLDELGRSVRLVYGFLSQAEKKGLGRGIAFDGDARSVSKVLGRWQGRVDAVITSPPYATALPYLDTDRLSLTYLGLLSRKEHRQRDLEMIGNREVSERERRDLWEHYDSNRGSLPGAVVSLVDRIAKLNEKADVGFRRRNLPSLLSKYFIDMGQVFDGLRPLLRRHGKAFVVIGNNHTYAGGQRVEITTDRLLSDVAEMHGFENMESIPMEMLISRDIFKKNSVSSETILVLRKV